MICITNPHLKKEQAVNLELITNEDFINISSEIAESEQYEASFFDIEGEKVIIKDSHDLEYLKSQQNSWTVVEVTPTKTITQYKDSFELYEKTNDISIKDQVEDKTEVQTLKKEVETLKAEPNKEQQIEKQNPQENAEVDEELKLDISLIDKIRNNCTNFDDTVAQMPEHCKSEEQEKMKNASSLLSKEEVHQVIANNPSIIALLNSVSNFPAFMTSKFDELKLDLQNGVINNTSISDKKNTPINHKTVRCDSCGVYPIIGKRFKCLECHDFDFCEKCEKTVKHDHPMLRITETESFESLLTAVKIQNLMNSINSKTTLNDIKAKILKKIVGCTYEESFYEAVANKSEDLNLGQFLCKMEKIFG